MSIPSHSGTADWPKDLVGAASAAVAILDPESAPEGVVLHGIKGAEQSHNPASLAKLMTALLAIESDWDTSESLTVAPEDVRPGSGRFLKPGDRLSFSDALHALLIPSSNTAAELIARNILDKREGTSGGDFVSEMNQRASKLGLTSTHYMNPSGLYHRLMRTTANDTAKLLTEVARAPYLRDILGKRHAYLDIKGPHARSEFIRSSVTALGHRDFIAGKTGTRRTVAPQYNVAILAQSSQDYLAIAVLGAASASSRYQDARAVVDYWKSQSTTSPDLATVGTTTAGQQASSPRRELSAETAESVAGGQWTHKPDPPWTVRNAVRASRVKGNARRLPVGTLVVVQNPVRELRELEQAEVEPGRISLLVDRQHELLSDRFPALVVDSINPAMDKLAEHARSQFEGKVVAVTGSAGKTTTSHMLAGALSSRKSTYYTRGRGNIMAPIREHCLRLRDEEFAVVEIASLALPRASFLLRPDVAVVTQISAAHLRDIGTLEDTAETKASIFAGLHPEGTAVLNLDAPFADTLLRRAREFSSRVITYGTHNDADVRLVDYSQTTSSVHVEVSGKRISYQLGMKGMHNAMNSLAVVSTLSALDLDLRSYLSPLERLPAVRGRGDVRPIDSGGRRLLIVDQAYNANPASMVSALDAFGAEYRERRRVLVLGDMLELGEDEAAYHASLLDAVLRADPARVYLLGPLMVDLWKRLPAGVRGAHLSSIAQAEAVLKTDLEDGDAVLIKASGALGLSGLIDMLRD